MTNYKPIMICGIDCFPNDKNCNNYCNDGRTPRPPEATREMVLQRLKADALKKLDAAQKAMHLYASECEVGTERTTAFDVYENIRTAARRV